MVTDVVEREEATQLVWTRLSDHGSSLSVSLFDKAGQSDILSTQFRLKYRVARDPRSDRPRQPNYVTRYEGTISAALVQQDYQRFILDIGQLPIDADYVQSGLSVEIELTAIRSLSGRSTEQTILWRGSI